MRRAFGFQGLSPGLAGSKGSRAFGPQLWGIVSYALGSGIIAYLDAGAQAMAAHTTKLYRAP